ncbi:MAG: DEAD/DEAH box helicase family protein, partial [Solirubrobacterales bacterium]
MAEKTKPAAKKAAKASSSAEIERAREFAREPFLLEGETPKDLAEGTPRRRALDAVLAEIEAGNEAPSIEWRRDFSLMLGLERVLAEEKPQLADGAELDPHQVDALSGTLAALIADVQERINGRPWTGNGNGAATAAAEPESPAAAEPETAEEPSTDGAPEDLEEEEEATEAEEAKDWSEEEEEEVVAEAPEDPGASRRFWFEHATGSGKTVAAVGFIEASRTGGVLILTHRRNLVDQFIGE